VLQYSNGVERSVAEGWGGGASRLLHQSLWDRHRSCRMQSLVHSARTADHCQRPTILRMFRSR